MDIFKLAQTILSEESKQRLSNVIIKEFQSALNSELSSGLDTGKEKVIRKTKAKTNTKKKLKKKTKSKKSSYRKALKVGGREFASIRGFADFCGKPVSAIYAANSTGKDLSKYLPKD